MSSNSAYSKASFDKDLIDKLSPEELDSLLEHLRIIISDERVMKMEAVLAQRTRHVTVVVEDIRKAHNANAILRTAECLGIQDVYFSKMSPGKPSIARGIVKGSHKWVDIHSVKGVSPEEYTTQLTTLKQNGYTLVAADPAQGAIPIDELPIDKPIAFIFGTENFGLSDIALQAADYKTFIPMFGFTESFNVSVSAAICLRSVMNRLRESHIDWQLSSLEQKRLLGKWLIVGVNRPMIHLKQVVKREIF